MLDGQELFKTVLDHLHEGVYFVDPERRIQYWNKGAERVSGFSADEVRGSCCHNNILVHVDPEGRSLCQGSCALAATLADGQDRSAHVYLRHKEGHRVPVLVSVAAVRDTEDRIVGGVETFHEQETPLISALRQIDDLKQTSQLCAVTGVPNA